MKLTKCVICKNNFETSRFYCINEQYKCKHCLKDIRDQRGVSVKKHSKHTGCSMYIISNPAFKGWLKVGRTVEIEKRLNSYQTADPLRSYKLEYLTPIDYPTAIENYLKPFSKGEWIYCELDKVIKAIECLRDNLPVEIDLLTVH